MLLELQHPALVPRKRPGTSRQSRQARALRKAKLEANERRKADLQFRRERRISESAQTSRSPLNNRKQQKKSKKKKQPDTSHNYRRKKIIKEEKLANYYRNLRGQGTGLKHVFVPKLRGRRYFCHKRSQRKEAVPTYSSMSRAAALHELYLKRIVRWMASLPRANREYFSKGHGAILLLVVSHSFGMLASS